MGKSARNGILSWEKDGEIGDQWRVLAVKDMGFSGILVEASPQNQPNSVDVIKQLKDLPCFFFPGCSNLFIYMYVCMYCIVL